ncbi:MAG: hypothetical protein RBJ76_02120 [Stenomitos frigidus ULC029]
MHLLKCTAVTFIVMTASVANAQPAYLTGDNLKNAISGQTLIARDWAEFYKTDGNIVGKVRYCFLGCKIYSYTGTWTAQPDRLCYYYPPQSGQGAKNTCSKLTLNGETVTHYELTGKLKKDGVAQRKPGNALRQFR